MPDILIERTVNGQTIRVVATEGGSMVISDKESQLITLNTRRLPALLAALLGLADQLDVLPPTLMEGRAFRQVVDSYLAQGGDAADLLPLDLLAAWQRVKATKP